MPALNVLQSLALRCAASWCSGRGDRTSLVVLTYHRVLPVPDPLLPDEPDTASFAAQVQILADNFNVLPLAEACDRLRSASLPERALCITFDDGYANNLAIAAPILAERRLPATVFIATGFLDGGRMFNDTVIEAIRRAGAEVDLASVGLGRRALPDLDARQRAIREVLAAIRYLEPRQRLARAEELAEQVGAELPGDLMLTTAGVRQLLAYGIEVGAHTATHPILCQIGPEAAYEEILNSKRVLEDISARKVDSFAYPNGGPYRDYDSSHVGMVRRAGFVRAVSTADGAATHGCDLLQIPRVFPWYGTLARASARVARSYTQRQFLRV